MCLMGIVQKLFLAYENPQLMKYIIPGNIFDIPDIWVWINIAGSYPILDQTFRRESVFWALISNALEIKAKTTVYG